jgi:DNA-binding CsgD family transcriptional regulator
VQNLSIVSPQKTAVAIARRPTRANPAQLLERVLGAAEDAILDRSQTDAVLAHLGGRPYRVRLRTLDGLMHVIVAIVDSAPPALPPVAELRARFGFTEREAEVARLLAARLTNKEIARALGVTAYTAERHTERILAKLGINSRRHVHGMIAAAG